jgi:hypothetical protein
MTRIFYPSNGSGVHAASEDQKSSWHFNANDELKAFREEVEV